MSIAEIQVGKKIKQKVKEPTKWAVIFLNDDVTPVEFVISLLVTLFNHEFKTAETITMNIHNTGSGVAGVYSYEIAETKANEAIETARNLNFPLRIKLEET